MSDPFVTTAYLDETMAGIDALQQALDEATAQQNVKEGKLTNAQKRLADVRDKRRRRAKGGTQGELFIVFIAEYPLTKFGVSP